VPPAKDSGGHKIHEVAPVAPPVTKDPAESPGASAGELVPDAQSGVDSIATEVRNGAQNLAQASEVVQETLDESVRALTSARDAIVSARASALDLVTSRAGKGHATAGIARGSVEYFATWQLRLSIAILVAVLILIASLAIVYPNSLATPSAELLVSGILLVLLVTTVYTWGALKSVKTKFDNAEGSFAEIAREARRDLAEPAPRIPSTESFQSKKTHLASYGTSLVASALKILPAGERMVDALDQGNRLGHFRKNVRIIIDRYGLGRIPAVQDAVEGFNSVSSDEQTWVEKLAQNVGQGAHLHPAVVQLIYNQATGRVGETAANWTLVRHSAPLLRQTSNLLTGSKVIPLPGNVSAKEEMVRIVLQSCEVFDLSVIWKELVALAEALDLIREEASSALLGYGVPVARGKTALETFLPDRSSKTSWRDQAEDALGASLGLSPSIIRLVVADHIGELERTSTAWKSVKNSSDLHSLATILVDNRVVSLPYPGSRERSIQTINSLLEGMDIYSLAQLRQDAVRLSSRLEELEAEFARMGRIYGLLPGAEYVPARFVARNPARLVEDFLVFASDGFAIDVDILRLIHVSEFHPDQSKVCLELIRTRERFHSWPHFLSITRCSR